MSGGSTPYKLISPLRLVATFCVLAPMVAVIAVPTYNSATPELGGFPFYYWYQLLLVVITGVLMVAAFWAIRLDEGRRRQARPAGAPAAAPTTSAAPEGPAAGSDSAADPGADADPDPRGEGEV